MKTTGFESAMLWVVMSFIALTATASPAPRLGVKLGASSSTIYCSSS